MKKLIAIGIGIVILYIIAKEEGWDIPKKIADSGVGWLTANVLSKMV